MLNSPTRTSKLLSCIHTLTEAMLGGPEAAGIVGQKNLEQMVWCLFPKGEDILNAELWAGDTLLDDDACLLVDGTLGAQYPDDMTLCHRMDFYIKLPDGEIFDVLWFPRVDRSEEFDGWVIADATAYYEYLLKEGILLAN